MSFQEQLKRARFEKGFTQHEMATRMGITASTYCGYETGKRQPSMEKIKEIAEILEVSVDTLLEHSPEKGHRLMEAIRNQDFRAFERLLSLAPGSVKNFDDLPGWEFDVTTHPKTIIEVEMQTRILNAFDQLNPEGQTKAVERVEELTEIPKYQKPHD